MSKKINPEKKQQAKESRLKKMGLLYFILLGVAGVAILWSTIRIQWVDGEHWRQKAENLAKSVITVPAHRGDIYSSDGTILVSTVKVADLAFDFGEYKQKNQRNPDGSPKMMRNAPEDSMRAHIDEVAQLLAETVGEMSASDYKAKMLKGWKDKRGCLYVAKEMPYSAWMKIRSMGGWRRFVKRYDDTMPLVREKRVHTYGSLAGNVLGYANSRELKTYTGLEGMYDSLLRGQDGIYYGHLLSRQAFLTDDISDTVRVDSTLVQRPVINGSHIISTIDSRYQDVAENALCKMLRQWGGASGCVVMMEVETGYVLACANVKRDSMGRYYEVPFNNVALSHIYEPGSTFKTVVLTAMLNDGMIDTSMRVRTGWKNYGAGCEIVDSRGHQAADTMLVSRAFVHSSNVGMAELGYTFYRNQRNRLRDSIMAIFPYLGDGKLHLDLNDPEYAARITDPNRSLSDFLRLCYGYANMVSPMQVLTFYNAMAHPQRQLMKPMFCKAVVNGRDTAYLRPRTLMNGRPICSAETQQLVTYLLTDVVNRGTATNLRNETYLIAGKTGTANTVYGMKGGEQNNGSFVGFFPADRPKYTCIVVGEGIGNMNGRQTAVAFKEVADCVMAMDKKLGNISLEHKLKYLETNQVGREAWATKARQATLMRVYDLIGMPYNTADSNSRWVTYNAGVDSLHIPAQYTRYEMPQGQVPNCAGMTAREAVALLKGLGVSVEVQGVGRVKSQTPAARTPLKEGTKVKLILSNP